MTTEQMIRGIHDLEARNIPVECIYNMASQVANMLLKLKAFEDTILSYNKEKDYVSMASFRKIKAILSIDPADQYFEEYLKKELSKNYGKPLYTKAV